MQSSQQKPRLPKPSDPYARIAFYGPMASGKTFLANHLVKEHNYIRIAFADKLKAIAYELFGVSGKDGADRELLQRLGDQMRAIDPDVWVRYVISHIKYKMDNGIYKPDQRIVIDDLRLKNESVWLVRNGFHLVRVTTDEVVRLNRIRDKYPNVDPAVHSHVSEVEWGKIMPDMTIINNDFNSLFDLDALLERPA